VSDEKETARLQYEKQVAAEQQAERDRIEQGEREAEALKEQNR
jgi:hypothetical protein